MCKLKSQRVSDLRHRLRHGTAENEREKRRPFPYSPIPVHSQSSCPASSHLYPPLRPFALPPPPFYPSPPPTMPAFAASPLPLTRPSGCRHPFSLSPRRPISPAKRRTPPRQATMRQKSPQKEPRSPRPPALSDLKHRLLQALSGLERGLSIDADSPTMDDDEALVEDLIERIEDLNEADVPTKDPRMSGTWELLYTSSSITRYFGGATGLQRLLPAGEVGWIRQHVDPENGTSEMSELLRFEVPVVGTPMENVAVAKGKIRATSKVRQVWDPEDVKFYFFKQFADGWKTLRAFQIADTTFLDETLRITRGQTGSVNVFAKSDGQ